MKKIFLSAMAMMLVLGTAVAMSSCKKLLKGIWDKEESPVTETMDISVNKSDAPSNDLDGYDPSDATAFGLVGPVKKVFTTLYSATLKGNKLQRGERIESDGNNTATFNRQGLVTCDFFGSPYTYDSNGKFIKGKNANTVMERSPRGLIESYQHKDNTEEGHWNAYTYEFKYDQEGRMINYTYTGWEEIFYYTLIYEGDNVYPSGEEMEGQACADIFKDHITYKITKMDKRGNWTEREVFIVSEQGIDTGVNGGDPVMEITKTYQIETRKIEYYE